MWQPTHRIEHFNYSGSKAPGCGTSVEVMELDEFILTKSEHDSKILVPAEKLRYKRQADGVIHCDGTPVQGYLWGINEDISEWRD